VKSGIQVDAMDDEGVTALSWAVFNCQIGTARKLLELGANPNHTDQRGGLTPLMYTATTLRGHYMRGSPDERAALSRSAEKRQTANGDEL
jgi:ankyrin repeat protein